MNAGGNWRKTETLAAFTRTCPEVNNSKAFSHIALKSILVSKKYTRIALMFNFRSSSTNFIAREHSLRGIFEIGSGRLSADDDAECTIV